MLPPPPGTEPPGGSVVPLDAVTADAAPERGEHERARPGESQQ